MLSKRNFFKGSTCLLTGIFAVGSVQPGVGFASEIIEKDKASPLEKNKSEKYGIPDYEDKKEGAHAKLDILKNELNFHFELLKDDEFSKKFLKEVCFYLDKGSFTIFPSKETLIECFSRVSKNLSLFERLVDVAYNILKNAEKYSTVKKKVAEAVLNTFNNMFTVNEKECKKKDENAASENFIVQNFFMQNFWNKDRHSGSRRQYSGSRRQYSGSRKQSDDITERTEDDIRLSEARTLQAKMLAMGINCSIVMTTNDYEESSVKEEKRRNGLYEEMKNFVYKRRKEKKGGLTKVPFFRDSTIDGFVFFDRMGRDLCIFEIFEILVRYLISDCDTIDLKLRPLHSYGQKIYEDISKAVGRINAIENDKKKSHNQKSLAIKIHEICLEMFMKRFLSCNLYSGSINKYFLYDGGRLFENESFLDKYHYSELYKEMIKGLESYSTVMAPMISDIKGEKEIRRLPVNLWSVILSFLPIDEVLEKVNSSFGDESNEEQSKKWVDVMSVIFSRFSKEKALEQIVESWKNTSDEVQNKKWIELVIKILGSPSEKEEKEKALEQIEESWKNTSDEVQNKKWIELVIKILGSPSKKEEKEKALEEITKAFWIDRSIFADSLEIPDQRWVCIVNALYPE